MPDANETTAVSTAAENASNNASAWTSTDHHLIGTTRRGTYLSSASAQGCIVEGDLVVTEFSPEHARLRQPALWRGVLSDPNNNNDADAFMAVDQVAEDISQATKLFDVVTSKVAAGVVEERLALLLYEQVLEEWLPSLILVAACEEVTLSYLASQTKEKLAPSSTSTNSETTAWSVPRYYRQSPNTYLTPPLPPATTTTTSASSASSFSLIALPVTVTPAQLVARIKQGCQRMWKQYGPPVVVSSALWMEERRVSSRLASTTHNNNRHDDEAVLDDPTLLWKVVPGGNVALYLARHLVKGKNDGGDLTSKDMEKTESKIPAAVEFEATQQQTIEKVTSGAMSLNVDGGADQDKDVNAKDIDEDGNDVKEEEGMMENASGQEADNDDIADVVNDDNPYLTPSDAALMEWFGRRTAKLLTVSDMQSVFPILLFKDRAAASKKKTMTPISEIGEDASNILTPLDVRIWSKLLPSHTSIDSSRLVFRLVNEHDDQDVASWGSNYFGRTPLSLCVVDDAVQQDETALEDYASAERAFKQQKQDEIWRYRGIHGGHTVWSSWFDAAAAWRETTSTQRPIAIEVLPLDDHAVARELAEQQEATDAGGRRTRRGGDKSGVFYGSQSNMTQKQLMDTILRLTSEKGFHTAMGIQNAVPDESSDPYRRIRTALGRLVWKRNQIARVTVQSKWSDQAVSDLVRKRPVIDMDGASAEAGALVRYIQKLHQTELQLRSMVLDLLTKIPAKIVATSADERAGSMESMDDADFEVAASIEWLDSGHELLGCLIYRPSELQNTDEKSPCRWYQIKEYSKSLALSADATDADVETAAIGSAKEPTLVERRIRFRAMPTSSPGFPASTSASSEEMILLTEAQVSAGLKAADMVAREDSRAEKLRNPFSDGSLSQITLLVPGRPDQQINGLIVGHDSVVDENSEVYHKILVLPDLPSSRTSAFWATLLLDSPTQCNLPDDRTVYTIQQFDYDSTSPAFRECRAIVKFLEKHAKAGPFLEPVDPVALYIPTYPSVVKHPMDISTLSLKLENGDYSIIPPSKFSSRSPISRMLNGPFRKDVELIFNNAMLFNPSYDWIHQAASTLKKAVIKKIEQASSTLDKESSRDRARASRSMYVDDDSDIDMYVYESDQDEDYTSAKRKRKRPSGQSVLKEDTSARAMERVLKLQKVMTESSGLRGPLADLPIMSDPSAFSLSSDWTCCHRQPSSASDAKEQAVDDCADNELDELLAMNKQLEEHEASGLRRSTRAFQEDDSQSEGKRKVSYVCNDCCYNVEALPKSRLEVEDLMEKLHESYFSSLYKEHSKMLSSVAGAALPPNVGRFSDESFPPYLGRVIPAVDSRNMLWEIRSAYVIPALRWVIRGLIHSGHLSEVEPLALDSLSSGAVLANHIYYIDDREPFEVLDTKELQRRKRADKDGNESSEGEIELSEYEKLRAERVSRNAERLKALGLG
jgi:hypothetical protein